MNTILCTATQENIDVAASLLQQGEVVGIPTETVYGLAANALDEQAVAKIFQAKGRPQDNPLISHISSMEMLSLVASNISESAYQLAKAFWPGPLTMVLPRSAKVSNAVCAGLDTAAVRMPSHPIAQAIITASGVPLAAPSANLSGSPSPTNAQDVYADMQGRVPMILDGGDCTVGVESTVISLVGETPMLLRPGYVTKEAIEQVLGQAVTLSSAIVNQLAKGEVANSPGMKYQHYAPKAKVIIVKGSLDAYQQYVNAHAQQGVMALCFEGEAVNLSCPCVTYGRADAPETQAQHLFSALRRLDDAGATTAYARCPQETGVALAVYNRLLRAAGFCVVDV